MTAMFIFKEVLYFMEKKNLALYIILSIVTCGIFALVWMAMLANDLRTMSNDESKMSGRYGSFAYYSNMRYLWLDLVLPGW